jgi:prolyl-tRNA synthetase
MEILGFYREIMEDYLAVPVLAGKKTENEKFAGALYTMTLEAMMPDGKALQMGTSHNLGQHFSKVFEIKFLDEKEKESLVWQTSWGISTRMIGALILVHGDDKGLVLPPKVAPVQVVIVPIPYKDADSDVILSKAKEIFQNLQAEGIEVILDDRTEYTPGWKFNEWELKGVPIRIEIGPRDMKQKQVMFARRDTHTKNAVKEEKIAETATRMLDEIQTNLFNRAKKSLEDSTIAVKTYDEFKKILNEKGGFIKASWCGDSDCEAKTKEETGATIRLISPEKEKPFSKCVRCGREAKEVVYFARSY